MNWPTAVLGDLCEMDRRGIQPNEPSVRSLPFVGVENVESGSGIINLNNGARVGDQRSTNFHFDQRHVLYGKLRPYLNKVAVPAFTGKCSTELVPLLPRAGVDRDFLGYLLRRKETVEYVMASVTGARMPRTDMKTLMSLVMPFPPLDKQQQIVSILDRAAKIERLRRQAQKRLKDFIPALFVKMFGDPIDNPMGWNIKRISDVGFVGSGSAFPRKEQGYRNGKIPFLKVSDMNLVGNGITIQSWANAVSEETRVKLRARAFPAGSVIFPKVGAAIATNKKRLLNRPSCFDNNVMAVTPSNDLDTQFLYALLLQKNLSDFASDADPPSMRKTTIEDWKIPCPPIKFQRRFARILDASTSAVHLADRGTELALTLSSAIMAHLLELAHE